MAFIPYDPTVHSEEEQLIRSIVMDLLLGEELPIITTSEGEPIKPLVTQLNELVTRASRGYLSLHHAQRDGETWIWVDDEIEEPSELAPVVNIQDRFKR
jgi:hypothetical protein